MCYRSSRFIVADFSAIEARVLAWFADEQCRMNVFANGGDIYCASASSMFHVPVEKDCVNKELRAKGKVAELACGLIIKWHKSNPKICNFWRIMESCAKYAVRNKTFKNCRKGVLFIV